jgi:hypothetical protein
MGLQELRADATLVRERLAKLDPDKINYKSELCDNLLPLFEGLIDAIGEEVLEPQAEIEEALDDLIDQASDVLHPETAAKIAGVIEYGKLLAAELEALMPSLDDIGKKRVRTIVKTYRQGAEVVGQMIIEMTVPEDEDDEGEELLPEGEGHNVDLEDGIDPDDEAEAPAPAPAAPAKPKKPSAMKGDK